MQCLGTQKLAALPLLPRPQYPQSYPQGLRWFLPFDLQGGGRLQCILHQPRQALYPHVHFILRCSYE